MKTRSRTLPNAVAAMLYWFAVVPTGRTSHDFLLLGHGVNLVGNHGYYTQSSTWATNIGMDYYLGKGMRVFRIVFAWEWIQPVLNGPLNRPTLAGLDADVNHFGRRDLNFGNFPPNTHIVGEHDDVTAADMADAWSKIAVHYASNPRVIFELMNEPHDQNSAMLVATYNRVIEAIRATGATNPIMIDGNDWSNAGRWVFGSDNNVNMLNVTDSANNLIFDVHQYFDKFSAGQSTSCIVDTGFSLYDVTSWARNNRKRLFLGEFSGGKNPQCYMELKNALAIVANNSDVWVGSAWWGAYAGQAPYNSPDRFWYTIDPGGGDIQDFTGVTADDPRMSILRSYLPL